MTSPAVFRSGPFRGVSVHDTFARAASEQSPVIVKLPAVPWPSGLAPTPVALGSYAPGETITGALNAQADVLIVLYTEQEISALLDVFTQNNTWGAARRKQWNGYAHNFAHYKPIIQGAGGDDALEHGLFGYLSALTIGNQSVVLYKTELHPKQNGAKLPFIPVLQQLISELAPKLVLTTGTAGAIGAALNCGDVAICESARFHVESQYPSFPAINAMSASHSQLTNAVTINTKYLDYASMHLTRLSLPGLNQCYTQLQRMPGYSFVRKSAQAPTIYVAGSSNVPGTQPMDIVSADYLTVDDNHDAEGLQALGTMNDTDDAFLVYALNQISGPKPAWLSVRNASEPQIVTAPFPAGTSPEKMVDALKAIAGSVYGIYQYCTTLNSAFACWGIVAAL
jgi:nucleoside phosphorylase